MKAIICTKYGSPDDLQIREVPKPIPKDYEVLVKVFTASINDWDWGLLLGKPLMNRMISGLRKPKIKILGCDVAGRVEAVGEKVHQFKPGDEVFGDLCQSGFGSFAEYVCVPEKALTIKPYRMTFEEAASFPQAGMLAVQGLRDKGHIQSRKKVLINGAGGGVGTIAVQIAKLYDTEVTGVDCTGKLDMLRSMGFDHVIDYTKEDFTKNGQHYDLILDVKTNRSIFDYIRSLSLNGIYVTVGGSINRIIQLALLKWWVSIIHKKTICLVALKPNKDLGYICDLFENGKIKPVIDGPFKFEEIPKAFRHFGRGEHKGKVVITLQEIN